MAVPPFTENPEGARPYFRLLRDLRDQIAARKLPGIQMDVLSMGMSQDFEVAIEEGSTCVRVGTAIFWLAAKAGMIPVHESARGITLAVKVHPRARKNAITGVVGDALKLALTAPPVEGKANQAVIEFFADLFAIPRSSVTIASGETSRNKIVRIAGLSKPAAEQRLAENIANRKFARRGDILSFSERLEQIKTGFERPFWVANVTEIFERLSYYAVFASIVRYLHENLNFSAEEASTLSGQFGGWVWFLAIFGGTIADELGFRRARFTGLLILSGSYFLLGSLAAPWLAPVRETHASDSAGQQ